MKLAILAFAILLPGYLAASPLPNQPHVYVEGAAELEVEPDTMIFTLAIQAIDPNLASAKSEVDTRSHLLIATVKKFGVKAEDVATTALNIRPEYEYRDNLRVLTGNQVSRQVDITLRDLKKYPEMMKALVDSKVTETISTNLTLANKAEVEDKVQVTAMANAKVRAMRLAQSQGREVGEPWSISEFNNRASERWELHAARGLSKNTTHEAGMTEMKMADSTEPFEPGVIQITAQVFVVYLLK